MADYSSEEEEEDTSVRPLASKKKKGKKVPAWFFDKKEDVCGLTKAAFIWWSNVVCACFHLFLAITSVIVSVSNGTGMDTPKLTLYLTNLTWTPNRTDMLIPKFQETEGASLAWMTFFFFFLSFAAHTIIVLGNYKQALYGLDEEQRYYTAYTGWYFAWITKCKQPLRWFEYSFSASLMIITIAVAAGVSHLYMIICAFALMWCTMLQGYYTEVLSRPEKPSDPNTKPTKWVIRDGNRKVLAIKTPGAAVLQRLAPHILGYVPYTCVWVVLLHSFFYNTGGGDGGPPAFVYVIVIGQFTVFTFFGATQLANQISENGPEWYFWGEWSYLVLSLFSKGLLGLTLISTVLLYSSLNEAVSEAS